ncbi:MAG: GlcG/HbpS family heme-binding protein [Gammaproteobacteria bacterium]
MKKLTLDIANQIIDAALAKARADDLPPMGCAVLDAGGHLKAFQAEDGLAFARVHVCHGKAWGSLGVGVDSNQIAERYVSGGPNPGFINALNAMTGGKVVPLAGGVLLRNADGEIVGAVGVSGAKPEEDEVCARAGVDAAR